MARKKTDKQDNKQNPGEIIKDYSWLEPYHFKPGKSGNPNGRPPKQETAVGMLNKIGNEIRDESGQTRMEVFLRKLFEDAIDGNQQAREIITTRLWGAVIQKQISFDFKSELIEAAKESNVTADVIRNDDFLLAVFTAAGINPDSAVENATLTREGNIIENNPTQND